MAELAQEEVPEKLSLLRLLNQGLEEGSSGEKRRQCANEQIKTAGDHVGKCRVNRKDRILLMLPELLGTRCDVLKREVYCGRVEQYLVEAMMVEVAVATHSMS